MIIDGELVVSVVVVVVVRVVLIVGLRDFVTFTISVALIVVGDGRGARVLNFVVGSLVVLGTSGAAVVVVVVVVTSSVKLPFGIF